MGTGPRLVPMVWLFQTSNRMTDSTPARRRKPIRMLGGVLILGAACFWGGRLSVSPVAGPVAGIVPPNAADAPVPADVSATPPTAVSAAGIHTRRAPQTASGWDEQQWQLLSAQPGTVARNAALATMLEKLAALDPDRAMALAKGEVNLKLRNSLVQAALHGWARSSPSNAANWALALADPSAREAALTSVFAGALAVDPEAAVQVCSRVCQQDPGNAAGYGSRLIDALCEAGNFDAAAQLANQGDGAAQRSIWMAEAYSKWAELQPEQAAAAAAVISDPDMRNEALHGVAGGWAATDPAGLAKFLSLQPPGGDRGPMLGQALQNWVTQDPAAAANWINDNTSAFGPDLDQGVESVATLNTIKPDLAVNWAESIDDGRLRSAALTDILRNWVQTDFSAAQNFFEATPDLQPADRQQIAEIIAGINGPTAMQ